MKKLRVIFFGLIAICFGKVWGQDNNQVQYKKERLGMDSCSFKVRFYSEASGPDLVALEKTDQILREEFKNIRYKIMPWGREGERDYCFYLNEMELIEQNAFVGRLKSALNGLRVEYIDI